MALFYTDSVTLAYSNLGAAKQWWMTAFDCRVVKVPKNWDICLPSDIALQLPGHDQPTILLTSQSELNQAGFSTPDPLAAVIFCTKLKKGHDQLSARGVSPGQIQDGGDTQFFDIRDSEGHSIQICQET
jgi:hypothetical protein